MWLQLINDVTEVINKDAFINLIIQNHIVKIKKEEKSLYTKILYGVVENKKWIDFLIRPYVNKGRFKPHLKNAIRVGAFSLSYLQLAPFYVVTSLVDAIKKWDYHASKALNAILRSFISDNRLEQAKSEINRLAPLTRESIIYNIDEEVLKLIKRDYPNDYQEILKNEEVTYNTYRINLLKTTIKEITNYLDNNQIEYKLIDEAIITKSTLIDTSIFQDALIIPQDLSSMKVAKTLNPPYDAVVLDTCSAPGSKAFHLATIMNNTGRIIACDIYEHKLNLIKEEASRQGISNIDIYLNDATKADYGRKFKYILVDAPCSGMGTMKHKSDLKLRLTIKKINEIIEIQRQILNNAIRFLAPGGFIVYSTCTINKDENENRVRKLIAEHPDLKKIEEYSFLPNAMQDGFYICKLQRKGED